MTAINEATEPAEMAAQLTGTSLFTVEEQNRRLDAAGFVTVTIAEFLGMTKLEAFAMAMHGGLKQLLRDARRRSGLTQAEVAGAIGSGQPRIAKLESGDPKATVDLLIRASIAAGATPAEIAGVFVEAAEYASGVPGGSPAAK